MEIIKIAKYAWTDGLDKAGKSYQLFGPVEHQGHYIFRHLEEHMAPDMGYDHSVLSPKSVVFPQTQKMLEACVDPKEEGYNIFNPVPIDDTPRVVIGIRPFDARALQLVRLNFDTGEYRGPLLV